MIRGLNVLEIDHEQWLDERRKGICGTDASCILGVNPWKSIVNVYLDKVGELQHNYVDNFQMKVGRDLEAYVAHLFEEETGKKVRRNNFMLHHNEYPCLIADIDRQIVGENAILECKTANSYAVKDWESEPPLHYQMQCLHYMLVTGCDRVYIAALIGNEKFIYYCIERDEEVIEQLKDIELDFWNNNVLAHVCPPPDGSKDLSKILGNKYPQDNGEEIVFAPDDYEEAVKKLNRYHEVEKMLEELSAEKESIKQFLQTKMQDSAVTMIGDNKITWKTQSRASFDKKKLKEEMPEVYEKYATTSSSRVMRISEKKK